jgi:hypothetical protein
VLEKCRNGSEGNSTRANDMAAKGPEGHPNFVVNIISVMRHKQGGSGGTLATVGEPTIIRNGIGEGLNCGVSYGCEALMAGIVVKRVVGSSENKTIQGRGTALDATQSAK